MSWCKRNAQVRCCSQREDVSAASNPTQDAVTHQLLAYCFSAVVPLLEKKHHDAVVVANAEALIPYTLVLADAAQKLPCNVQEESCTCLLRSDWQIHVGQQVPIAMLSDLTSFAGCLRTSPPLNDHRTQCLACCLCDVNISQRPLRNHIGNDGQSAYRHVYFLISEVVLK